MKRSAQARRGNRRRYFRWVEFLEPRQLMSLTHLYTFNDGTASDAIGTAHGTLTGGATIVEGWLNLKNTTGVSGTLLMASRTSADAAAQYVQLPGGVLPANGSATVEVWYTTSQAMNNWMRVFDFGDKTGVNGNSYLGYTPRSASNDARGMMKAAGGTERTAVLAGGTFDGRAHLASLVVDAGAGQLRLYVDGVLAQSSALSGTTLAQISPALAYIGRSLFDADSAYTGQVDELRIYNEALSAAEIAGHAASGAVRAQLTASAKQIENLDRGLVAFNRSATSTYMSWRLLATDPTDVAFNVYRITSGGAAVKLTSTPLTKTTDYTDSSTAQGSAREYFVRAVVNGVEQADSRHYVLAAGAAVNQYISIPLVPPVGGEFPDTGTSGNMIAYTYVANDASVGDLDGDGQYEVVLKWDPTNAKDNSQDAYTGNVYVDAYRLDGTRLWRINLGKNIRAGAHYTQFQVYDLDGDGKAEVAMKTAPGTIDGLGNAVLMGADSVNADYRNGDGYILTGPEYLTVFNGLTGANMATRAFEPARGSVTQWGDGYGNRVDRFTATVAYLDGQRPSLVMGRGYYGPQSGYSARNEIAAYDYRNGQLTLRWHFKAGQGINNNINSTYIGQGPHGIAVGDVDRDGKDEIIYGACAIDDNGQPLYTTRLGHGDAFHLADMDQTRVGIEFFMVHESPGSYGAYGGEFRSASGTPLVAIDGAGADVGRGNAFDLDPRYPGFEMWTSANGEMWNVDGTDLGAKSNVFQNFAIQWDGEPLYELLDGTTIANWNITAGGTGGRSNFTVASGVSSNNSTKSTPSLAADIFGDWRDEVIWRSSDNLELRIYSTVIAAASRMVTPMQDVQYRESVAWQNSAYNQPPGPSYYMGDGMRSVPAANIYIAGGPSGMSLSANAVPENAAGGTAVGNLASTTLGTSSTFTYAFVTGAGSEDNAKFALAGNQLRTNAVFDFEARKSYSVRLRVTDAAGKFFDRQLTIGVSDVNEAPTVVAAAGATPSPAAYVKTNLTVLGADVDAAGEAGLTYTWAVVTSPDGAAATFSVNGTNAAKNTTVTVNKPGTYLFGVTVRDGGNLAVTSTVTATFTPLPGDANGDGQVDLGDFDIWFGNVGGAPASGAPAGDFNFDNQVDLGDFDVWFAHVGASASTLTSAAPVAAEALPATAETFAAPVRGALSAVTESPKRTLAPAPEDRPQTHGWSDLWDQISKRRKRRI